MNMNRKLFSATYNMIDNSGTRLESAVAQAPHVDINEGHTLIINDYDHDLKDYMNREFSIGVMCNEVEATGFPHSWNKQDKIPHNTKAVDPRYGTGTKGNEKYTLDMANLDKDYGRDNWQTALPRCHITGIRYGYFNSELQKRYGSFNQDLLAKDMQDMFVDYTRTISDEFWNGKATALNDDSQLEYMGILAQITDKSEIKDTTIAKAVRKKMAEAMAQTVYLGSPNVIAMNPVTYDLLCEEEEQANQNLFYVQSTTTLVSGIEVPAIRTQAGTIPILLTPYVKVENSGTKYTHKIVALNTSYIDRVWLFSNTPRLFVTKDPANPLNNEALLLDKNLINFDTYILHGAETPAHFILTKVVDTAKK